MSSFAETEKSLSLTERWKSKGDIPRRAEEYKVALARVTRGWHRTRAAVLSIAGFLATVMCYLGVNLILSGLHSYGD